MNNCKRCGSYAINVNSHGRDNEDTDLCDVCYWRKRAELAITQSKALIEVARMPNQEYVADAHNSAVRILRMLSAKI